MASREQAEEFLKKREGYLPTIHILTSDGLNKLMEQQYRQPWYDHCGLNNINTVIE